MEVIEVKEITSDNIYDELWSGGRDTLDDLTDEQIDTVLENLASSGEEYSLTDLNDFFWFERDTIAEWLGYDSYDDLMNGGIDVDALRKDNGHYFDNVTAEHKKHNTTTMPLKLHFYEYDKDCEQFI